MSLVMPEEKSAELAPTGSHLATCFLVIDLGTQETNYDGKPSKKRRLQIAWELAEEVRSDGTPFVMRKKYTLSSSPKSTLRNDLEAWRAKKFTKEELGKFHISKLLRVPCMLAVTHDEGSDGNTYANVSRVMALPKGIKGPPLVNEPLCFDLGNYDAAVFAKLPDYLKEIIEKSPEHQEITGKKLVSQAADDIPFGDDDGFEREPGQEG
jgi:hypothetical protein